MAWSPSPTVQADGRTRLLERFRDHDDIPVVVFEPSGLRARSGLGGLLTARLAT